MTEQNMFLLHRDSILRSARKQRQLPRMKEAAMMRHDHLDSEMTLFVNVVGDLSENVCNLSRLRRPTRKSSKYREAWELGQCNIVLVSQLQGRGHGYLPGNV